MGFYHTTENPCVMMRVNHKTKSCECIIIHQDELYIASNTLQEILHNVKEEYKITINPMIIKDLIFLMIQEEQWFVKGNIWKYTRNYISTLYISNFHGYM